MNLSKVIHAYRYLSPGDVPHELRDLSHSLSVNEQLHFASLLLHMILNCNLANIAITHQNFHSLIAFIIQQRGFVSELDYLQLNVDGLYKQLLADQKSYVHDQGIIDIKGAFVRGNFYV